LEEFLPRLGLRYTSRSLGDEIIQSHCYIDNMYLHIIYIYMYIYVIIESVSNDLCTFEDVVFTVKLIVWTVHPSDHKHCPLSLFLLSLLSLSPTHTHTHTHNTHTNTFSTRMLLDCIKSFIRHDDGRAQKKVSIPREGDDVRKVNSSS